MSRRAALAALQPYLDAVNVAPAPAPRKVGKTFSDAVQEWREQIAVNPKPSTVRAAESHLSQHIIKRLGNLALQQANVKHLQAFVTTTAATGVTRKTLAHVSFCFLAGEHKVSTLHRWNGVAEHPGSTQNREHGLQNVLSYSGEDAMPIALSILLSLLLFLAPQGQPVIVHITTSDAIDLARMIARDEGYDVTKTTVYSFDLLTSSEGKPFSTE